MPSRTSTYDQMGGCVARRVLAAIGALLFGLGFGLNFGVSNENTYLLGGLRMLHPGLLARDWLTTQTTPYHRLFAYPVAALLYLDSSGWLFAAANVVVVATGAAIIFKLVQRIAAPPGQRIAVSPGPGQPAALAGRPLPFSGQLLAFVLVLLVALATRTLSIADSTLYTLTFDPATLGATGFLLGMYLFAQERYVLSGVAIAAGGVFHANYLILSFPVLLIAHLALRRQGVLRPLLRQFAVPVVALLALLPIIAPIALQPGSAGTNILLTIRSPHHYQPLTFRDEFVPFLGWLLLFGAGLRRADVRRADVQKAALSPAVALAAAMILLVILGTALTTFAYVSSAAQLYVWRLAPLVVLLAQMHAVRLVGGAGPAPGSPWLLPAIWRTCCVVIAGECFVDYYYLQHRDWLVLEVLGGIALLGLLAWAARWRGARAGLPGRPPGDARPAPVVVRLGAAARRARPAVVVLLLAGAALAVVAAHGLTGNSNLLAAATPESQLYSWVRTTTDPDAVFLIPPDMDDFRLSSQRAVVVDWKSTPFTPAELDEWYRRIDALSGRAHPRTVPQAAAAFAKLSGRRLANLADLYIASYVVLREPLTSAPPASWQMVFDNGRYRVLRTGVVSAGP